MPEQELDLLVLPLLNISEMKKVKMCFFSSTISSDLLKPVLKCLPCWDVFPLPSVINPLWLPIWELYKRELPPLKKDPLLQSKLFMSLPMILPIPPQLLLSLTWMLQLCLIEPLPNWEFILLSIPSIPPPEC